MRNPEPIEKPILRFEYNFDAEILDPDLRRVLAGEDDVDVPAGHIMAEVRRRIEAALAATPGLRVGQIGLSELRCAGVIEMPAPIETT